MKEGCSFNHGRESSCNHLGVDVDYLYGIFVL